MANAGCINAYDCNGCLIQTLQNLDSACIGVGVQYTAPNPLDDKKIDYIKYTDKCGCTCCLTGENEILIYATNGVIKNLTLTNDDTNEAVVVKWNDIFGSNRAKTVVRYKTGSAPVSPTDGTLAVEETTKNQYSTNGFSVTGLSDSTTYYFSVFALDIDGTMIDVQTSSITTAFFLSKYQKVEYIQSQSTGEGSQSSGQYINTGYKGGSTIKIEIKISGFTQTGSHHIIGSDYVWEQRGFAIGATRFTYYNTVITLVNNKFNNGNTHILQLSKDGFYNDGTIDPNTLSTNTFQTPSNITIFALNRNGSVMEYSTYKLHYLKIRDNGNLVRNFVPCYRKSDNVIGLLDIVNKVFYTNQGTGSFTKGPNI